MRISEADPTEDDLLLKGSEERGEAVAVLPFPSRVQAGEDVPPFAPVQRPVPRCREPGCVAAAEGTAGTVEAPQRGTCHVLMCSGAGWLEERSRGKGKEWKVH